MSIPPRSIQGGVPCSVLDGYAKDAPELLAKCVVSIGNGLTEWGAEPGVEYYRFHILKIMEYRTR